MTASFFSTTSFCLLMFALMFGVTCSSASDEGAYQDSEYAAYDEDLGPPDGDLITEEDYAEPVADRRPSNERQWVNVMDQSFNLAIYREQVPTNWQVFQKIQTHLNEGGFAYYLRDIYTPEGFLLRDLGNAVHNAYFSLSADMVLTQAAATAVENPRLGQGQQPSQVLESSYKVQVKRQEQMGQWLETWEVPFSGQQAGQPVRGMLFVIHTPWPQIGNAGFLEIELVAAPADQLDQAIAAYRSVLSTRQHNPDYIARKNQFNQQMSQRMAARHQQRMQNARANFDAHQARMRDIYAASDARHESYMNQLRSTPTTTGSSGYSSHDAFIDQTHERSTFTDPGGGQEVHRDGQYDYWYTDGQGNYHGTDDPTFNPHSLQGNWRAIEPNRPNGW